MHLQDVVNFILNYCAVEELDYYHFYLVVANGLDPCHHLHGSHGRLLYKVATHYADLKAVGNHLVEVVEVEEALNHFFARFDYHPEEAHHNPIPNAGFSQLVLHHFSSSYHLTCNLPNSMLKGLIQV